MPQYFVTAKNPSGRNRGDVFRAKDLLLRARQQPLSDLADAFVWMAEGIIAQEEGNLQLAVEKLEQALVSKRRYAKGNPSSAAVADCLEGRLALAKALIDSTAFSNIQSNQRVRRRSARPGR